MTNNVSVGCCSIISTHLKRPVTKNIEYGITHIINTELKYSSPSDRYLSICLEGVVTSRELVDIRVEIIPYYIDINHPENKQALHKSIIFNTKIPLKDLLNVLQKELQWVLDYFGFTIMYITQSFKHIKIVKEGKGYTLEYAS